MTTVPLVRCPMCEASRPRVLNRLPGEEHAVYRCVVCGHTWCEEGRSSG